jgi:hypothetical protein
MNSAEALESSTIAEMEETIARIASHKGIEGVIIMDRRGTMCMLYDDLHLPVFHLCLTLI